MKQGHSQRLFTGLGVLGALCLPANAFALDLPECSAGEYLWLVTAGNPSGTLMPKADMRVGTVSFQDWTDGTDTLRTASFTNVPKGILGSAKTFERYSGGGSLGWFAKSWPTAVDDYEIENFKPLPARNPAPTAPGGEYPTDFASSKLIDGSAGQTLAQVLSHPGFDGKLTYVAPLAAKIDFVTIALCTSALPVKAAEASAPPDAPSGAPVISNGSETLSAKEIRIRDRMQALAGPQINVPQEQASTPEEVAALAAAARQAAEAEAREAKLREEAKLEEERLEEERVEAERLEAQKLEAERLAAERLKAEAEQQALEEEEKRKKTGGAADPVKPPTKNNTMPDFGKNPAKLKSQTVTAQTKRDMIMSGTVTASALINVAGNALAGLFRASPPPAPTPAPSPAPQPAPTQASGGARQNRRKKKNKETAETEPQSIDDIPITDLPIPDMPSPDAIEPFTPLPVTAPPTTITPSAPSTPFTAVSTAQTNTASTNGSQNSQTASSLADADKGILFTNSPSSTGPIPNAPAAVQTAYDAVGRVGYPHAPHAAKDAMNLGFGSAVLIASNKVLTNYHVWDIIKNKPGIGIEFEARENNEVSEFITLVNNEPERLEGLDAVVLTLSRKLPRTAIWPEDLDYTDPALQDREVYAIGHPIKPEDESWLMKDAIEQVFGSAAPQWNVKRHSTGPLTGHSQDRDGNILYDVPVREAINQGRSTPALCHRASTIGGNSGGAIICAETGAFLGLHFGGQYLDDEDINYAVPGRLLRQGLEALEGMGKDRPKYDIFPNSHFSSGPLLNSLKSETGIFTESPYSSGQFPKVTPELMTAYQAVGRVGRRHNEDDTHNISCGSAVLITKNQVLTNFHVWQDFLQNRGEDIGVEFEAIDGSDESDFIPFTTDDPIILENMDAVILTLAEASEREPLWPEERDISGGAMAGTAIYCIGYPIEPKDANYFMRQNIETVFDGQSPKWHYKHWTAGEIIIHSADEDSSLIYDVPVRSAINPLRTAPALLHNASSLGGNSGGAIICRESGAFLGLHFGGGERDDETVNYAVPASHLLQALRDNGISNHFSLRAGPENDDPITQMPDVEPEPNPQPEPEPETEVKPESLTEYLINTPPDAPDPNAPDDLTRIEGIGPKTAAALQEHGIRTFEALSQGSPYDLPDVLEAAGLSRRDPTTWPAQAALAHAGDWERLKEWQDKLHGGREV